MGKSLKILVSFLALLAFATPGLAKDFTAVYQDAEIENATVSSVTKKGVRTLQLKLTNTAVGNLTILGVKGASHKTSKIIAQLSAEKYVELDSLAILSEETLDMEGAGIFIQLHDIKAPIKSGSMIDLKLVLLNGEMPFQAHVTESQDIPILLN